MSSCPPKCDFPFRRHSGGQCVIKCTRLPIFKHLAVLVLRYCETLAAKLKIGTELTLSFIGWCRITFRRNKLIKVAQLVNQRNDEHGGSWEHGQLLDRTFGWWHNDLPQSEEKVRVYFEERPVHQINHNMWSFRQLQQSIGLFPNSFEHAILLSI